MIRFPQLTSLLPSQKAPVTSPAFGRVNTNAALQVDTVQFSAEIQPAEQLLHPFLSDFTPTDEQRTQIDTILKKWQAVGSIVNPPMEGPLYMGLGKPLSPLGKNAFDLKNDLAAAFLIDQGLRDENEYVQMSAARAISCLDTGDMIVSFLNRILKDDSFSHRVHVNATDAIHYIADAEQAASMIELGLKSPYTNAQIHAGLHADNFPVVEMVPRLIKAILESKNEHLMDAWAEMVEPITDDSMRLEVIKMALESDMRYASGSGVEMLMDLTDSKAQEASLALLELAFNIDDDYTQQQANVYMKSLPVRMLANYVDGLLLEQEGPIPDVGKNATDEDLEKLTTLCLNSDNGILKAISSTFAHRVKKTDLKASLALQMMQSPSLVNQKEGLSIITRLAEATDSNVSDAVLADAVKIAVASSDESMRVNATDVLVQIGDDNLRAECIDMVLDQKATNIEFSAVRELLQLSDPTVQLRLIKKALSLKSKSLSAPVMKQIGLLDYDSIKTELIFSATTRGIDEEALLYALNAIKTLDDATELKNAFVKQLDQSERFNAWHLDTVLRIAQSIHYFKDDAFKKELIFKTARFDETHVYQQLVPSIQQIENDDLRAEIVTTLFADSDPNVRQLAVLSTSCVEPELENKIFQEAMDSDDYRLICSVSSALRMLRDQKLKENLIDRILVSGHHWASPRAANAIKTLDNDQAKAKFIRYVLEEGNKGRIKPAIGALPTIKNEKLRNELAKEALISAKELMPTEVFVELLSGKGLKNTKMDQGKARVVHFMRLCALLAHLPVDQILQIEAIVSAESNINKKEQILSLLAGLLVVDSSDPDKADLSAVLTAFDKGQDGLPLLQTYFLEDLYSKFEFQEATRPLDTSEWNMDYLSHIASVIANRGTEPEFMDRLGTVLAYTFHLDFNKTILDPLNEVGSVNAQTKVAFTEAGLDYDAWLNYAKENELLTARVENDEKTQQEILDITAQNIVVVLRNLLGHRTEGEPGWLMEMGHKKVKNALFNTFSKSEGYAIKDDKLVADNAEKMSADGLLHLCSKIEEVLEHHNVLNKYVEVNLKKLNTALAKAKTAPKENVSSFTIKVWDRNPGYDLYQGEYSDCCIALDNEWNKDGIFDYLLNTSIQLIEVKDEQTGQNMGTAFLYWAKDENGQNTLVVDNIEFAAGYSNKKMRVIASEVARLTTQIAQKVSGDDSTPVYWYKYPDDQVHPLVEHQIKVFTGLGAALGNKIYLDSRSHTFDDISGRRFHLIDPDNVETMFIK